MKTYSLLDMDIGECPGSSRNFARSRRNLKRQRSKEIRQTLKREMLSQYAEFEANRDEEWQVMVEESEFLVDGEMYQALLDSREDENANAF